MSKQRYFVRQPLSATVSLEGLPQSTTTQYTATVVDISLGGMCLRTEQAMHITGRVAIDFSLVGMCSSVRLPASMRWTRPDGDNGVLHGFEFLTPLRHQVIDHMIDTGLVDRRKSPRIECRVPVSLFTEVGATAQPAVICDVSEHGVCLTMKGHLPPTGNVLITLDRGCQESVTVELHVRWTSRIGGDVLIGGEYVHGGDATFMQELITQGSRRMAAR